MERVRLRIQHADAGYVEEKLGMEFYSQLGGIRAIAEFRLGAVERVGALYEAAISRGDAEEPEVTALGLLVLQRALLACEDLGALIHALVEEPHWDRFTSYSMRELDETFAGLLARRLDVRRLWLMPSDELIDGEERWDEQQGRAIRHLREISTRELELEVDIVARFWGFHRRSIKNVMHGFSLVPAHLLLDPPGAGVLSEQVDHAQERPFAASLVSEVDEENRIVKTTTYAVDLTLDGINAVRTIAAAATSLLARLADTRRFAVETRHHYVLSQDFADRLTSVERESLTDIVEGPKGD
jgi:hypothetical protein